MAYDHQKVYHRAIPVGAENTTAVSFTTTGIKATFSPGIRPMKLRAVAVVVSTQMTVTPPVLTIKHRPTAGSATGETTVDTITVPLAQTAGKIVYVEDLNQLVRPGEHIVFDVTTAATAGAGDIIAEFDPVWESLANETDATLSA
jgi:hypothetical protein